MARAVPCARQEQLQIEPFEAGEQVPIDESQVVAGHVLAKIGELDALPLALALSLALHAAAENLAANELQALEPPPLVDVFI